VSVPLADLHRTIRDLSVKTSVGRTLRKVAHLGRYHYFRLIGDERNFSAFHSKQFYLSDSGKRESYTRRGLYMEDEGAAVCYAFGVDYVAYAPAARATDFKTEVKRIIERKERSPQLVVNVGCGLGTIDAALAYAGVPCIGIDPSPGAREGYVETFADWLGAPPYRFINNKAHVALAQIREGDRVPDTVIMCESIEHIPKREFDSLWSQIVPMLRATAGVFIVTNGLSDDHFPVIVDGTGWCHIRQIDDDLYDYLGSFAKRTLFRYRSHLVLQF
jgi:SAM-dependent methyltransferase